MKPFMPDPVRCVLTCLCMLSTLSCTPGRLATTKPQWPQITTEAKPWSRWWWMGSAVTPEALTSVMETYRQAGLGGLEITPIYGVMGYEDQFIPYLSSTWMQMLSYTLAEADRLDLGIDMATGTGWPFGGPWVTSDNACKYVVHQTYTLKEGESLSEPLRYRQVPLLRSIGRAVDINDLRDPIADNEHLQALALDQVRFAKPLPLQVVMAYADTGRILDLTGRVDAEGRLDWVAPAGHWTLYAVFQGWHGKMVERAAPGGEGNVIDHFSRNALQHYLSRFDQAFSQRIDTANIRAFFNDSYEVDDARGQSNWTDDFFTQFQQRRGYDLREHLPALFGQANPDERARVLCDYRETLSDLLLEAFTQPWQQWARRQGALVRNQAHGSPGNLLDLYAAADIPETEGTDAIRIKFASSAAHVTGKSLVSSESATWLNEHFTSSLADIKRAVERFWLGGVNHIVYHGTNFSPPEEPWPGWLFYAAVHLTPANPLWRDFPALNAYVARTQAFLQSGRPDNDVLLYFPVHDIYSQPSADLLVHFRGGGGDAFDASGFKQAAQRLQDQGYGCDFISDRQLQQVTVEQHKLMLDDLSYQTIILPQCHYVSLTTFERLVSLARQGATVVSFKGLPEDVSGLRDYEKRRRALADLKTTFRFTETETADIKEARVGKGKILLGDDLGALLVDAGVRRESMVDQGLQYIRRRQKNGYDYFIVNRGRRPFDDWITLAVRADSVAMFDPMRGISALAETRQAKAGLTGVYLQLAPGESRILRTSDRAISAPRQRYYEAVGPAQPLTGTWSLKGLLGGPAMPLPMETTTLKSWTDLGPDFKPFAGTVRYQLFFDRPEGGATAWRLDLGRVCQSARVRLNGNELGTLLGPTYRVVIPNHFLEETNLLVVEVTNLMANRIADLDRRKVLWKKFYNVNFPARLADNRDADGLFTAAHWEPLDSGLIGPVTLTPLKEK